MLYHRRVSPPPATRIASARRSVVTLLTLAVALPSGCELLFARQRSRLAALADDGAQTVGEVTSYEGPIARYRYAVDGQSFSGEVDRTRLPALQGTTVPVRYLPASPSLSRPVSEGAALMAERTHQRRVASLVEAGVALFFLAIAGLSFRELRRAQRGVDPRSPEAFRARRNEALVLCAALVLAVTLAHADDARSHGESLAPVAAAAVISGATIVATLLFLSGNEGAQFEARRARMMRWAVPVVVVTGLLRALVWLISH